VVLYSVTENILESSNTPNDFINHFRQTYLMAEFYTEFLETGVPQPSLRIKGTAEKSWNVNNWCKTEYEIPR
jgi:hypothetical protein